MTKFIPVGKVTLAKTWSEIKYERMAFVLVCEVRGCNNSPSDAHHIFLRTDRRKAFKKAVDQVENMQIVCKECHGNGRADSWTNQREFMRLQKKRFNMQAWWNGIPEKKQMTNADVGGLIGFI